MTEPEARDPRIILEYVDGEWIATAQDGRRVPDWQAEGPTPIAAVTVLAQHMYGRLLTLDV